MTGMTGTSANGGGPALALALLLVGGPLLAGLLLGDALRQWRGGAFLGVLAIVLLTFAALEALPQLGAWDTISLGGLVAAGLLLGRARLDRGRAWVLIATSVLALAGLEAAVRFWLPPPPHFPAPGEAALVFKPAAWDAGCLVLYGAGSVDDDVHVLRRSPPDSSARRHRPLVVHLGDSMTFGEGVGDAEAFPALLHARHPTVVHRNYGVWAVGTDFQYLLLRRVLAEHSPAMVVLHIYVGNDIYDIDRPYACCDAGPLLEYGPDGPAPRCERAHWSFPLGFRLSRSPPPYPLRVATFWSYTARHAAAAFSRLVSQLEPGADYIRSAGEATESDWHHFTQILATMRDEIPDDVALVVDLLPSRQTLEADHPTISPSYRAAQRIAQITAELGIPTLDAWHVFADAVKRDGSRRYFRNEHDIHLTPEGHRLLADWLETQLPQVTQSIDQHQ
jgi:lysophospholipase L1-like esterase